MRVVCIGDSITAGQYVDFAVAWPSLLSGFEVIPRGVSGETTRQGLERFPRDVQEREPDVVLIQYGLNDCTRWETDNGLCRVSLAAFEANLGEMVTRVENVGATPMLLSLTPTLKTLAFQNDARMYDGAIRHVARRTGARLIDVAVWLFADPERYLLEDGVHLNEIGHKVYACGVQDALMRVPVAVAA